MSAMMSSWKTPISWKDWANALAGLTWMSCMVSISSYQRLIKNVMTTWIFTNFNYCPLLLCLANAFLFRKAVCCPSAGWKPPSTLMNIAEDQGVRVIDGIHDNQRGINGKHSRLKRLLFVAVKFSKLHNLLKLFVSYQKSSYSKIWSLSTETGTEGTKAKAKLCLYYYVCGLTDILWYKSYGRKVSYWRSNTEDLLTEGQGLDPHRSCLTPFSLCLTYADILYSNRIRKRRM